MQFIIRKQLKLEMESNNELKIDLYPENKPQSELKKESIQTIINK